MCYLFGVKYEIMPLSAMFDNSREKEVVARGLERQDSLSCMQITNVLTKWILCKVYKITRFTAPQPPFTFMSPNYFRQKVTKSKFHF